MLKLSRLILGVLILISFLYKSVYSSAQTDNVRLIIKTQDLSDLKKM